MEQISDGWFRKLPGKGDGESWGLGCDMNQKHHAVLFGMGRKQMCQTLVLPEKYRNYSHSVQCYQGLSCSDTSSFWAVHFRENMVYLEIFQRIKTGAIIWFRTTLQLEKAECNRSSNK